MSEEKKNPAQEDTKLNLDQLDMVSGGDDNEASRDEWGGSGSPGSLIDKESGLRCPVCGSKNVIQMTYTEENASFVCLDCKKQFTL